tara:strand:- start:321 stop:524 length:204 start_codon:yes stop_codon:yes gene_type:complete
MPHNTRKNINNTNYAQSLCFKAPNTCEIPLPEFDDFCISSNNKQYKDFSHQEKYELWKKINNVNNND